jgi:hypothetical protein
MQYIEICPNLSNPIVSNSTSCSSNLPAIFQIIPSSPSVQVAMPVQDPFLGTPNYIVGPKINLFPTKKKRYIFGPPLIVSPVPQFNYDAFYGPKKLEDFDAIPHF